MKRSLVIIFNLFLVISSFSQINKDSLLHIWNNVENHDSIRLKAINKIAWDIFIFTNRDSSRKYADQQLEFAIKVNNKLYQAKALNTIGVYYYFKSDFNKALEYYANSLRIGEEINSPDVISKTLNNQGNTNIILGYYDKAKEYFEKALQVQTENNLLKDIPNSLTNIGNVFNYKGDYISAVEYYHKSLKLFEEIGDKNGIGITNNNLGLCYKEIGENEMALNHLNKSAAIFLELGFENRVASTKGNIGIILQTLERYDEAIANYQNALKIHKKLDDRRGLAISYNSMGLLYLNLYNSNIESLDVDKIEYLKQAKNYLDSSLTLNREIGYTRGEAGALHNLALINYYEGNNDIAIELGEKSMKLCNEIDGIYERKQAAKVLYMAYKYKDPAKALTMFEIYDQLKDSLSNDETKHELLNREFQYEYEKKHLKDSLSFLQQQKLEQFNHQLALEKEAKQRYILYTGMLFLLTVIVIVIIGYQRKRKDNIIIKGQKSEIEEKHKEIQESINYAKRIQTAILPSNDLISQYLPHSFVLYKPKDVVAGDFYWLEKVGETTLFAAADCTGHGVPGAMVSVVCHNAMNRAVREFKLTTPGEVLDKTRELVLEELSKSDEDVKDGMDIAFCAINGNVLNFSGANNPLWIVREGELLEYKGDKQPIGKFEGSKPFTTHQIELLKGDAIYIFSDGYADQFGGEQNKKFGSRRLKELILSIEKTPIYAQKEILDSTLTNWISLSKESQLDDICVIGVKIS